MSEQPAPDEAADDEFATQLTRHGITLPAAAVEPLRAYATAMWARNEQINLTRHTTWDLFVGRDLRDCVQLAALLEPGEDVLDLGSGNGIPGIPLAILRPDVVVSLSESVGKRAKVLNELVEEFGLPVGVFATRGENLLEDIRFTTIVSRAVGSVHRVCSWLAPHWSSAGRLLLVKGPRWVEERGEARHLGSLRGLQLRVAARYPLVTAPPADELAADDPAADAPVPNDASEGVILQIRPGRDDD